MEKNRLLLNQKRLLSFSNYKNYINRRLSAVDNPTLNINSNVPKINLILLNEFKKNQNINARNVSMFRHKSSKIFDNNIRILSCRKNNIKINLSGNISIENQNLRMNDKRFIKNKLNINRDYYQKINDLLKKNCSKFHINERFIRSVKEKNVDKFMYSGTIDDKTFYRYNDINHVNINNEDDNPKILTKKKSENNTTRKLCKELFKKEINGIIVKRSGKAKLKYKIIGTLTTEPNHKFLIKT